MPTHPLPPHRPPSPQAGRGVGCLAEAGRCRGCLTKAEGGKEGEGLFLRLHQADVQLFFPLFPAPHPPTTFPPSPTPSCFEV